MVRIILVLVVLMAGLTLVRWFVSASPGVIWRRLKTALVWLFIAMLFFFVATGRLSALVAGIGGIFALILRALPFLLRAAPILERYRAHVRARRADGFGSQGNSDGGVMSVEEACQVLGVKPGASRQEVIDAHRRLIQKLHPDRGGSEYIAAKVNRAREVLLRSRG